MYRPTPIYEATVGSHAYGLAGPTSDRDYVRIVVPPPSDVLGPQHSEKGTQTVSDETDETTWTLRHLVHLAAKGTPNVMDVLQSPEWHGNEAVRTLARHVPSMALVRAQLAYAGGQIKRYLADVAKAPLARRFLVDEFGYDTKTAYHVARLIGQANAVSQGRPVLPLDGETLEFCRAIRAGEVSVDDWEAYLAEFPTHEEGILRDAQRNELPERPDRDALAAASVKLHRVAWNW